MDGCRVFVYESDPNHWYSSSKESFKFQIFTKAYGCRPRIHVDRATETLGRILLCLNLVSDNAC